MQPEGNETKVQKPLLQVHPGVWRFGWRGSGHVFPHDPQLLESPERFTQMPPQSVIGDRQVHDPLRHSFPPVHTLPQDPQLFGSVLKFTQVP